MDSHIVNEIPADLEKNIMESLDKITQGILPTHPSFENIIVLICDIIDLEEDYRRVICNPTWMRGFRQRWEHRPSNNEIFAAPWTNAGGSISNLGGMPTQIAAQQSLVESVDTMIPDEYSNMPDNMSSKSYSCENDEGFVHFLQSSTRKSGDINQEKFSKEMNFQEVYNGKLELENMCMSCGDTQNIAAKHPLFVGGLCVEHKSLFHENFFKYDFDGCHTRCSVCCVGKKVVLCDIPDCGRCYCQKCVERFAGKNYFKEAVSSNHWICFFCKPSSISLLRKRQEWQDEIQRLYQVTSDSSFPGFAVPRPTPIENRRPIRVLSLFDGIATGVVALKQLGLVIGSFVASEIDDDAIRLVQNRHPEVVHIGDITKLTDDDVYDMGPFDLLLAGSPCNDLSGANPRRKGLVDAEGTGCLFFDFYRILKILEPPRDKGNRCRVRPFFWLFENVVSMKGIEKQRISRFLQCEPRMADARYVSAAARPRLFWGNLPGLRDRKIAPGESDRLKVQECLEPGRKAMVEKLNTITTKFTCLYQGQTRRAPVTHHDKEDILWTTEVEKVFGVPEHYTDVNNLGPRERLALLGRSWSVPVIKILLSPLKEYFSNGQPKSFNCGMRWLK